MVPWPRIDVAVVASASASVRAQMTLPSTCSRTRAGLRVVGWTGRAVIIHTRTRDRQWTPADSLRGQFRPAKMPLWLAARKWGCLGVAPAPPNVFWDAVVVEFTSQERCLATPFPLSHTNCISFFRFRRTFFARASGNAADVRSLTATTTATARGRTWKFTELTARIHTLLARVHDMKHLPTPLAA